MPIPRPGWPQWSDIAIARTTPVLLGLFALVAIWADDMQQTRSIVARSAGWYQKKTVTFSDALAAVRRQLWADGALSTSPQSREMMKIPRHIYERMADIACYAT